MASSVTADKVEEIVEVDPSISLDIFIEAAHSLVTRECSDSGYDDETLELIEAYLAAHFYKLRDQSVASEKAGSVAVSYQYKIGMFLAETKEGQMAMILDTAGNLAALSKRTEEGESATVSMGWLGTDYETEEYYR